MESEKSGEGGLLPELCDWCGAIVTDGTETYGMVPDSSVVHVSNPMCDGQRLLTACGREHLVALQEQYRRRPFVEEELWAGKIYRAVEHDPEGLSAESLTDATGLSLEQIERCMAWLKVQVRRLREE